MLAEVGRREEGLAATGETVTLRRGLADVHPDAFLPDLLRSLATLVAVLRELNRPDGADATYLDVGTDLPPWAQARLLAARAPTRATKAGWADLVAAANLADTDPDTSIAAPARRTIRATAQNLASDHAIETAPPSETGGEADNAPSWLLRPYPENLAALLNIWITAESVVDQTAALETLVSTTSHPDGAADLAVLMALHADTSGVEASPTSSRRPAPTASRPSPKVATTPSSAAPISPPGWKPPPGRTPEPSSTPTQAS